MRDIHGMQLMASVSALRRYCDLLDALRKTRATGEDSEETDEHFSILMEDAWYELTEAQKEVARGLSSHAFPDKPALDLAALCESYL